MSHILVKSLIGSSLLLLGLNAAAQDRDRDRDRDRDDRYRNEERYHQVDRGDDWWRGHMFQRVREDLDHVQSVTYPFSADQYRLTTVKQELNEMQSKFDASRYDEESLNDTIGALQHVVSDNHLSPRDRDMLTDDLGRMRSFRERHEGYR